MFAVSEGNTVKCSEGSSDILTVSCYKAKTVKCLALSRYPHSDPLLGTALCQTSRGLTVCVLTKKKDSAKTSLYS